MVNVAAEEKLVLVVGGIQSNQPGRENDKIFLSKERL